MAVEKGSGWTDEEKEKAIERVTRMTEIYNKYRDDPEQGKKEMARLFEGELGFEQDGDRQKSRVAE